MQTGRPIELKGTPIAGGKMPLVCTPLVGRSADKILAELDLILSKRPDVLEWRVDFFDDIADVGKVIEMAARIRQAAGATPLLFTRRSAKEGGQQIGMREDQVAGLYGAVCASRMVDLIDFEMENDPAQVRSVCEAAQASGVKLVLSYHNFTRTPSLEDLKRRFLTAQSLGADVAKVAVMPQCLDDVLTLLAATFQASQTLDISLISMSMGPYGSLTRMVGGIFGSALTFAVGASSSAPGQVPIEDLNVVLGVLKNATGKR